MADTMGECISGRTEIGVTEVTTYLPGRSISAAGAMPFARGFVSVGCAGGCGAGGTTGAGDTTGVGVGASAFGSDALNEWMHPDASSWLSALSTLGPVSSSRVGARPSCVLPLGDGGGAIALRLAGLLGGGEDCDPGELGESRFSPGLLVVTEGGSGEGAGACLGTGLHTCCPLPSTSFHLVPDDPTGGGGGGLKSGVGFGIPIP